MLLLILDSGKPEVCFVCFQSHALLVGEGDARHGPLRPKELTGLGVTVGVLGPRHERSGAAENKVLLRNQVVLGPHYMEFGIDLGQGHAGQLSDSEDDDEEEKPPPVEYLASVVAMARLRLQEEKEKKKSEGNIKKQSSFGSHWRWGLGLLLLLGLLWLRYNDATYSVQWEQFYENYGLLGLPVGASLRQAKVAFHKYSLKNHPDKLGDRCDNACQDKFQKMTDAYAALRDFHAGRLKILNKPPGFSRFHMDENYD